MDVPQFPQPYLYQHVPQTPETPQAECSSQSSSVTVSRQRGLGQHDDGVYEQRPSIIYFKYLTSIALIVLLSILFIAKLSVEGTPVPLWLMRLSAPHPRITTQVVTIIASSLTASIKWAFAGAVTLLAKKCFQQAQPIYRIEAFSALKNGAVDWNWRKRPHLAMGTASVVAVCGLLTSGFVGLIAPFPIAISKGFDAANSNLRELDLSSDNSYCFQWYNETLDRIYGTDRSICLPAVQEPNSGLVYSTCAFLDQYGDILDAAKKSMAFNLTSTVSGENSTNVVSSFTQLGNTHIIGSTAGTLPVGPLGVIAHHFPNPSTSRLSYNYTLILQGIWAEVSCWYNDDSKSQIHPRVEGEDITYNLRCPEGEIVGQENLSAPLGLRGGLILAGYCYNPTGNSVTSHLRSFWNYQQYKDEAAQPPTVPSPSYPTYAGIGAMSCTLSPKIGLINATYRTDVAAFDMTQSSYPSIPFGMVTSILTKDVVFQALRQTMLSVDSGQTLWNGNLFGGAIRSVMVTSCNLTGSERDPRVPNLVAHALKGVFEYQVTHLRLVLTAFDRPRPEFCLMSINGTLTESLLGWDGKRTTAFGLLPLMIIGILSLGMIGWAAARTEPLTRFDPTSHVSLIAASSIGEIRVSHISGGALIGAPDDENIRRTRVVYGEHKGEWCLKSE